MRLVVGLALVMHPSAALNPVMFGFCLGCGILILAGLWTPVVGTLVVLLEIWQIAALAGDPWIALLQGSMGAALAMLGPGSWSADAYFFGWRRIESRPLGGAKGGKPSS